MNIDQFIRERRPNWNKLEKLLDVSDRSPVWELGHERIRELVVLYRQACSDLNQARSYTANPELLGRLNQLTGRAYRVVYQGSRSGALRDSFRAFMLTDVPAAYQRHRKWMALSLGAFALGAIFGFTAVMVDPVNAEAFIPQQFFASSPRERVEKIEHERERIDSMDKALTFGSSLYTNNIKVTFLAFSLGATTIVGGLMLIFYNGIILGAVAAMYYLDGVQLFFVAWVGPHGAFELPAIIFGGAAGLMMGQAVLLPGNLSREAAIHLGFADVWRIMVMACMLLFVAGLIEGSFSQFSSQTVSYSIKIAVAIVLFTAMFTFLFVRNPGGRFAPR